MFDDEVESAASAPPGPAAICVHGSHGRITADAAGNVIDCRLNEPWEEGSAGRCYLGIARFDIAEFREYEPDAVDIDILSIGWWTKAGDYEPPAHDWRKEIAESEPDLERDRQARIAARKAGVAR